MKTLKSSIEEVLAVIRKNPSYSAETAKQKMLEAQINTIIDYVDNLAQSKKPKKHD